MSGTPPRNFVGGPDESSSEKPLPSTRRKIALTESERIASLSITEKRKLYVCKENFKTLDDIPTLISQSKDSDNSEKSVSDIKRRISLWQGDITQLEIGAIVNAANETLLGGGGVDGAIHRAAGSALKAECALLNGCETGDAKITSGYKLPAKYVIHTVGPIGEQPSMLKNCYAKSLQLVADHKLTSVAFPCISTGIFGYPNKNAAQIAIKTVTDFLSKDSSTEVQRVIFCVFLDKDLKIYSELLDEYV